MVASSGTPPLRKSLGQHHLVREQACRPLVEFLAPHGRRVLEIGPGGGILTNALLRAGASVLGWELDPAWAFHLRAVAPPGLDLVVGDALDVPWERLPAGSLVAGNLPYQVATRIVQDLVRSPAAWECAAFLVQLEVAERLVAAPRQRAYGSLSVLVQARARVRLLGTVKPGAFRPPPAVDSAFVGLQPRSPSEEGGVAPDFDRFVRAGFARRRKTLRNNLLALGNADGVAAALAAAGVGPRMRPEELAVEAWQRLWAAAGAAGLQW